MILKQQPDDFTQRPVFLYRGIQNIYDRKYDSNDTGGFSDVNICACAGG
jgi:hypothetical protein